MSTVLNNANESGEVQEAQQVSVICALGSRYGEAIPLSEAIGITRHIDSNTWYIHQCDMSDVLEFEGKYYLISDCYQINIGSLKDEIVPREYAIELYSGNWCTIYDEEEIHTTKFTNKKFHEDEMRDERIVFLDNEGEYTNCEYSNRCIVINNEHGDTFYAHDSQSFKYIYCSDNSKYYEDEAACQYDELVYCEQENDWMTQETYDARYDADGYSTHHNTRTYHFFSRRSRRDDKHCGYSIGLEVEKEDRKAKVSIDADALYEDLGWCKETDGSLDDKTGFEAVSPVYSLFGKQMMKDLQDERIRTILNASYSNSCGGHINLSSDTFKPRELFEGLSAFLPLLYCLYENRIHEHYCQAKKKSEMSAKADKYSAVYLRENRIEFRIFPAVRSVDNFLWRVELIRIMVKNINATELQVFKMMWNKKSRLHRHLAKIMDSERIQKKCVKFLEYSKAFNDKNIDREGGNLLKLN